MDTMRQMKRNHKILLGLLAVLALTLIYRLTNPFEQGTVERLPHTPAKRVAATKADSAARIEARVRLDLLQSPPRQEVTIQRNLFEPPPAAEPPDENGGETPPPTPEPRPLSAREKIQAHFQRYKSFGIYRHGRETHLFLQRDKQVLVVTRGDRIDGKYEITDIAENSVTIKAQELPEPLKIDFEAL